MDYFTAISMYQEVAVGLQYSKFQGMTNNEVMEKWAVKHGREKILECMEALFKELDEKKEHYASLGKIALMILKGRSM